MDPLFQKVSKNQKNTPEKFRSIFVILMILWKLFEIPDNDDYRNGYNRKK